MEVRRFALTALPTRPLLAAAWTAQRLAFARPFSTTPFRLDDRPTSNDLFADLFSGRRGSRPANATDALINMGSSSDSSYGARTSGPGSSPFLPMDLLRQRQSSLPLTHLQSHVPKMGPTAGRSVLVQKEGDVVQALNRLRMILRQNNVQRDFQRQRFHEAPSLKRKRLKSERHRKRFKEGFRKMIEVVLDMKKKGM